jgi:hypothetical protein
MSEEKLNHVTRLLKGVGMDLIDNFTEQEIIDFFIAYTKTLIPHYAVFLIKYKNTHIYRMAMETYAVVPEHDGIPQHKETFYIVKDMAITDWKTGVTRVVNMCNSHNVLEVDFLNKYDVVYRIDTKGEIK